MPFKLRLRKTRHYNVLSRNVLVLSVELIDKTTLECTLSSDSTGLDCLQNVCQRLCLQQHEFFGLRYMSKRPYPKVRWVELDRPLKKQLDKYAQSPALSLAVQYYIHDVGLLQDDVTRSHYFLQVKQDVLEGRLRCNLEQAVLLASYSLQAEFGDHQPERHTPEYLKDFRLFPKQAVSEGEVGSLLDAVVWQYSSLTGLAQALAETYYILEAQRLPGYGQETFIARDEKGSEVYLGASLLGIVVEPASGALQTFYRWNDITNLINHKRNFGIECSRSDETVHFSFEEPDAAKYVWKMCVKQHTFYKGNQDVLEVSSGGIETRSLAIPDIQSSVLASYKGPHIINPSQNAHELVKGPTLVSEPLPEDLNSRTFASSLPHLDLSYIPKSNEISTQGSTMDTTQPSNHDSFNLITQPGSQPGLAVNASGFNVKRTPSHPHQSAMSQPQYGQPKQDLSNHHFLYSSDFASSSIRLSGRRTRLPQYRPAPDYETALLQKYGPGINSRLHTTVLYSSQPEISSQNNEVGIKDNELEGGGGLQPSTYNQYNAYSDLNAYTEQTPPLQTRQQQRLNPVILPGTLHNTYSTPELTQSTPNNGNEDKQVDINQVDYHFIHGYKPPPPYPCSKPSSNSTPDLASALKSEESMGDHSGRKRLSLLTASLGCLGSPELSRTYENLSELTDAVESLRNELTKGNETSFLHSFSPNYSTDDLDVIYQLSNGRVALGQSFNFKSSAVDSNGFAQHAQLPTEPIYQNVGAILSDVGADKRGRAKSAPELDVEVPAMGNESLERQRITDDAQRRASSHPHCGIEPTNALSFFTPKQQFPSPRMHAPRQTPSQQLHLQQHQMKQQTQQQQQQQQQYSQNLPLNYTPSKCGGTPVTSQESKNDAPFSVQKGQRRLHLNVGDNKTSPSKLLPPTTLPMEMIKPDLINSSTASLSKDPKVAELQQKISSLDGLCEFEAIPRIKKNPDFTSALRPENIPRNRYKDIIPYEENRVKITPSKDNKAGYINASHITASVGDTQRFYICAQGPLATTLVHFWQCVWETDVRLIVMLAAVEGDTNTSKSFPYWPQSDNSSVECDQFRIYRKQSTKSNSHMTSRLQLVHMAHRKSRSVWHLQFTDWADQGCPEDTHSFLNFLEELSTLRRVTFNEVEGVGKNRNTPVLVHCSAGVGRSGVTILCDLLMEASRHNLSLDPPKLLTQLRQQRMALVQTFNQYKFVYKVLLASLQCARLI